MDKLHRLCGFSCMFKHSLIRLRITPCQIFTDCHMENFAFLQSHSYFITKCFQLILLYIHTIYKYLSFCSIIKARNQIYKCRLSASGCSHNCQRFPGLNCQREMLQNLLFSHSRIRKTDIFKFYLSLYFCFAFKASVCNRRLTL